MPDDKQPLWRAACEMLCDVDYHEDLNECQTVFNRVEAGHPNAGSVGHAYERIMERLAKEYPDKKLTPAMLRFYKNKINSRKEPWFTGRLLPRRRPRRNISRRKRRWNSNTK